VCRRYDLDPLLGHISLYDGKPYVHYAGYLHIGNSRPQYEGAECVREWETETHFWATVRVHRSDRKFYFERTGKSKKVKPRKNGQGTYVDEDADAKAFAQAHRRALRMAFNVDAPEPAEDHGESPAPEPVIEVARMVDGQVGEQMSGAGGDTPAAEAGSQRPASDQTSPPARSGKPAGGDLTSAAAPHQGDEPAAATTTQGGDAVAQATDGEGPEEQWGVPSAANPAAPSVLAGPTPPIEQASPVIAWCTAHRVQFGIARLYLARQHPTDFGTQAGLRPLRSVNDLMALRGEDAQRAIAYLVAQFTDTNDQAQEGGP